jgi:hypothetical protein
MYRKKPDYSKHDVVLVMLVVSAPPATRRRRRGGGGGGRRPEADVLDGADGVEEEAAVELLHQRPVQQLAPHVHHRPVPRHPPPPPVPVLVLPPPRPPGVRRHAALPLQLPSQGAAESRVLGLGL